MTSLFRKACFITSDAVFDLRSNVVFVVGVYLNGLFRHYSVDTKMNIPSNRLCNNVKMIVPLKNIPIRGQEAAT